MWRSLLELLFPRGCCACGARPVEGAFCPGCGELLEVPPPWRCRRCAGPLPPPRAKTSEPLCPHCLARPPLFAEAAAPFVYGGSIADAIHRLKYRGRREVAAPLAGLIAGPCWRHLSEAALVAPIPLHPRRRRERGYDQAALLAKEVARISQRPYRADLLCRIVDSPRQVGQGRELREANLRGAFQADGEEAKGRRVVIVDDVITTCATARAAAEALIQAGASQVVVLAVARAL